MAQILLYALLAAAATMIVIAILEAAREKRFRNAVGIHREPMIDHAIDIDHFTDNYYQPAESTDEPLSWFAHQYKRDPLIWDRQDDGFYANSNNREFSLRIRRKLRLKYFDREGQETLRQIDTLRLGYSSVGDAQVLAYCHTYMRNLTFRVASISDCVDLDTGLRVLELEEYLKSEYAGSGQSSCDTVFTDYNDLLKVLNHLGGRALPAQCLALRELTDVCATLGNDERISSTMVAESLASLAPITREEFEVAVSRFTQMRLPVDLERVAESIVASIDNQDSRSTSALEYIAMRARRPVPMI